MKKLSIVATILMLSCNVALFASNMVDSGSFLTIVHPETWGLDGLIKSVLTIGVSYVIGLFTKKPTIRKKQQ